jgi:dihydrolipoamide dehydrogenase
MPSKLLIAAAELAHETRRAGAFGIELTVPARVNGPAVLERVRRERDRFVGFVVESTEALATSARLRGKALFVGPTFLEVEGADGTTRLDARAVVIATGATPRLPALLRGFESDVLTSETIFELSDLPESVAVLGTGVIALELGQSLHRLGVRTAFFGRSDRVGPATDPAIQRSVREVLGREVDLRLGAEVRVESAARGGFRVAWQASDGRSGEEHFAKILAATGRDPALEGLDLEKAGVELDSRGIPYFDPRTMQCGDSPIFLAGDAAGDRPLLHEAADEGRIAGANAATWPHVRAQVRRTPLEIVFTEPQIALVGDRFENLDRDAVEIGQICYEDQGRARVMGRNAGLVRVYGERECGTLIGAEMFGPRVEHTAHLLAWAVQRRLTVEEALACPFYHPVIEEGIQTALRDLSAQLKILSPARPEDLECGPGH